MKRVSVIIPTYNRAHLVSEAIQSVMNQDMINCDLEIIVVDDGSTDQTRQIVTGFGGKVRYIYQDNQGVGAARNRGIKEATGEWLAFLDSDDRWLPDKLSLQFKVLESFPKYKAVYSNFYTSENGSVTIPKGLEYWVAAFGEVEIGQVAWSEIFTHQYNSSHFGISRLGTSFNIYSGNLFEALLKTVCVNCWTMLVHKDCLGKNIRFAELPIVEDYWFCCKLSEGHDLLFLDCPTVENRAHPGPRESQGKRASLLKGCHIIYEQIYLPSLSNFRPTDKVIKDRLRVVNYQLLKEHFKNAELPKAKVLVREMVDSYGFPDNWNAWFYRMPAALPINIINHLVVFKRYCVKLQTIFLRTRSLNLLIMVRVWQDEFLCNDVFQSALSKGIFYPLVYL